MLRVQNYTKKALRQTFSLLRGAIPEQRRREASLRACDHLLTRCEKYKNVLSFASFRSEIDLWPLNLELMKKGSLLLPKVEEDGLHFYRVSHFEHLSVSSYHILEPNPLLCSKAYLQEIEVVLVPGLSFDVDFMRLGYGKGHYDRFLSQAREAELSFPSWGIGFEEQLSKNLLTHEEHDERLDKVFLF